MLVQSFPLSSFAKQTTAGQRRDDVAAVIVEDCAEIEPSPSEDLDVSEVRLPQLVDCRRLVLELIGRLQDDERRAGDQIMSFERAIHRGF